MSDLSSIQKTAVANAIATLMSLAKNSLAPTQTKMATRSAGNLLWLMGIEKYEAYGLTFMAIAPEGEIIDVEISNRLLDLRAIGGAQDNV